MRVLCWSSANPNCRRLWAVYSEAMDRALKVDRRFRKLAILECDWSLKNYMDAVERELEALNNDT